jgi:hypothetical protein
MSDWHMEMYEKKVERICRPASRLIEYERPFPLLATDVLPTGVRSMLRGYYEWAQWDILLDLKNGGSYETHQAVRDQVEWSVKPYVFLNTKAPE